MRVTLIQPCMGRRIGDKRYLRSWSMEPLAIAMLAAHAPTWVELRFYDDRLEPIPFDEPTDLVAITVETYTARRAYQIASAYRKRGVPVVMGGFHPTLVPEEAARFAESVVIGEAEESWPRLLEDYRQGTPQRFYRDSGRAGLAGLRYDRRLFREKRYLPIRLVETGRGCAHGCDFCAVQRFFQRTHRRRPVNDVVEELTRLREQTTIFFFVDDNFTAHPASVKALLRALIPLKIRWITQMSLESAQDEELLELMVHAGCHGVLIGLESAREENLGVMGKQFATAGQSYAVSLEKLQRRGIPLYATFVFGYDHDDAGTVGEALDMARRERFFMAAFNHLTPFPGTPLHARLQAEGRLLHHPWWLDETYSYNRIPFQPARITPEELRLRCLDARRGFFSFPSMFQRGFAPENRTIPYMFRRFFPINLLHRVEIDRRDHHPLGDAAWREPLIPVG